MARDAFEILGISPAFDVDRADIECAYLPLAAAIHPDLAAGDQEAARALAEINQARAILINPETRADVLLRRLGGPAADREKALPPGFLMDMMDVREQVEEAAREADPERRRALEARWNDWSRDQRDRAIREVGTLFANLPPNEPARSTALRDVRVRLNAWRYVERLIEQLAPPVAR